jgi:hypothetical protein
MRIEITDREIFAGGARFGTVGAYERITGIAHGEVDPADASNARIVDLEHAVRRPDGKVVYDTDVFILRPLDPARGNGALLYEVNNRGMKLLAGTLMGAQPELENPLRILTDPRSARDMGDGLLLQQGFTLVWSGWDPNAPRAQGGLAMHAPLVLERGAPVERTIRDEFMPDPLQPTGPWFHLSYPAVSLDNQAASLTMRWREREPGVPLARDRWRFVDARTVELLPAGTLPRNGALYELHYRATGSQVAGLGLAATRDVIAHLRHGADSPTPGVTRTLAFGASQSARFLRAFVAMGFNRDERAQRVFDGMLLYIGGSGKVFLNDRFSQPSRTNTQYSDHFYPDFSFPYSVARMNDAAGRDEAGVLQGDGSDPCFIEVNTSTEYWQKGASLISTNPQGTHDVALPATARAYFLCGLAHAPVALAQSEVRYPVNLLSSMYVLRALLLRLDAWVARGECPPPSVLPRIAEHTLVRRAELRWPAIAGLSAPDGPNPAQQIADWVEPRAADGAQPQVLVPQVDADGMDLGGLRMPEVAVPLGTALGWNLYRGDERMGQMAGLVGSFIAFARTRAERLAHHDPRPSLEERYADKDDYVGRFRQAVEILVRQGFVRQDDAAQYAEAALKTPAFDEST